MKLFWGCFRNVWDRFGPGDQSGEVGEQSGWVGEQSGRVGEQSGGVGNSMHRRWVALVLAMMSVHLGRVQRLTPTIACHITCVPRQSRSMKRSL